jgi:hypothetical protein
MARGCRAAAASTTGPWTSDDVVPFKSPASLRVTLPTPNSGDVSGMGIPAGVTLIVGGGFHGKSTLLRALERGVYDHAAGDGRERVVTDADAVKVRAEDGRSVAGTDISNFIGRIPGGGDTRFFETTNASGSTSQAAAIVEALEGGAQVLLLDEDTSATNFMIRDARMQALIADEHEPITPFIDRARQLADDEGVSCILVVGGSGDYFDVADRIIAMRDYSPAEVTTEAKQIAAAQPTQRTRAGGVWATVRERVPQPDSIDPSRGRRDVDIKARTEERVMFGGAEVELSAVEQLVEPAQARAIANAIATVRHRALDGRRPIRAVLDAVDALQDEAGLDAFQPHPAGEFAAFRRYEFSAFLNRIRGFRTLQLPRPAHEPGRRTLMRPVQPPHAAQPDPKLRHAIALHEGAVAQFAEAARAVARRGAVWDSPRAEGKWSPAQITLHIIMAFDAVAGELDGGPGMQLRTRPWMHIILRHTVVRRMLRGGRLPTGARAPRETRPPVPTEDAETLIARFEDAAASLNRRLLAAAAAAPGRRLSHPYFGQMPLHEITTVSARHVEHHLRQLEEL